MEGLWEQVGEIAVLGALALLVGFALWALRGWVRRRGEERSLLRAFRDELETLERPVERFDPGRIGYRDPIHLGALELLLSRGLVEQRRYQGLRRPLLDLQAALQAHNELVHLLNWSELFRIGAKANGELTHGVPPKLRRAYYEKLQGRHTRLLECREEVLLRLCVLVGVER